MSSQDPAVPDPVALAGVAAELTYGSCPLPDVAAAGQPRPEQLRRLADAGYRTIIDLRAPGEPRGFDETGAAREAGLAYESIPVTPQTLGDAEFDRLRTLLRNPSVRPAVVHCASANRVGALLIPYLVLDEGHSVEAALDIARRAGLRSAELETLALRYVNAHSGAAR